MSASESGCVLITGASRGLGAALARGFAAPGAALALCARGGEELRVVAESARAAGATVLASAADVADAAAVERWVAEATERLGPPRALVNNASVLGPRVALAEYPAQEWGRVMEINLNGAFHAARAVLPRMLAAGGGSIVNLSSGAAVLPRERWGAYSVSKVALEALSQNLAHELRGTGVRVNVVDPGSMRTEMRAAAYPEEDPATLKRPEAVVPLVLWLAGARSAAVTGERFQADRWRPPRG